MAFKKRGGNSRPKYSIATSVFIRKGKYVKGPSFGLWTADNGPMARGTIKEDYLDDLISLLQNAQKKELGVSFALFKNDEERDSGEYRSKRDDDDDDEKPSRRKREEEEDEDEKPARRKRKAAEEDDEDEKPSKKGGKKKDDWDFD